MLDLNLVRKQFSSLTNGQIFFDNPGGTQIAQQSLDRMVKYLKNHNANHGGAFRTSIESDVVLDEAHQAAADFVNAKSPQEIVFGNNMTTLTLHISRSISRSWQEGDVIVVTRLDHDANVTPWVLAAQDRGVRVRVVDFHPETGTLDLEDFKVALNEKPRLVAVGYASNALGTINPVKLLTSLAHAAGALVYIDAVQYAAHGAMDVQDIDCDFLVCSSYKFFGPHAAFLYGKQELLESLFAYKVRPAPNTLPGKFETGTQNHEGIAGVLGAIEYFEWLGHSCGGQSSVTTEPQTRRSNLLRAMSAIHEYELEMGGLLLEILLNIPAVQIHGLSDLERLPERVPTFSFTAKGWSPRVLAEKLAKEQIFVWDGNYYALSVTERLGLEGKGGMVRVGPVHYNTLDEIRHFGNVLGRMLTT